MTRIGILWVSVFLATAPLHAQTADDAAGKREELIIHGSRDKPLGEWAQMQAHEADYKRLKAKFDPDRRQTNVDADAAARDFAAPGGVHALQQEREAPVVVETPPP